MGGKSPSSKHGSSVSTLGSVTLELPLGVVSMLQTEAKRSRKPLDRFLVELLQDKAEERAAAAVLKRIKEGKEKLIPAEEVYAKLGL